MQTTTLPPNYWTYPIYPPAVPAYGSGMPPAIVDSWCPAAPAGLPSYSYSFPPMPWSACAPTPVWTSTLSAYPSSYTISPIDYTAPQAQFPDTVFTGILSQPSFPSTGFYAADPAWTQKMLEESSRETGDLEKQSQASQAAAQTSWNRNWKDYSDGLTKQLELDGKPVKG